MTEHERIVLTTNLPEYGLQEGDVGTILHVYKGEQAYEVEFVALTGGDWISKNYKSTSIQVWS